MDIIKIERGEDVIPFSKIATFAQPEGESSQEPEKLLLKDEVMIEGKDLETIQQLAESIAIRARQLLG